MRTVCEQGPLPDDKSSKFRSTTTQEGSGSDAEQSGSQNRKQIRLIALGGPVGLNISAYNHILPQKVAV